MAARFAGSRENSVGSVRRLVTMQVVTMTPAIASTRIAEISQPNRLPHMGENIAEG